MNYNTNQSIFIQIAERICDRVLSGNYKADSRIPSVRELAVEMEVNPNTVMRSFERLQANDIIYNKRGIGYFVASDARAKKSVRCAITSSWKRYFPPSSRRCTC